MGPGPSQCWLTFGLVAVVVLVAGCRGQSALSQPAGCGPGAASAGSRAPAPGKLPGAVRVRIRVNQVGYPAGCPKRALALLSRPTGAAAFEVRDARTGRVVLRGTSGRSRGGQNRRWPAVEPLDLSALRRPGAYYVTLGRARSPGFRVGGAGALYRGLVAKSVQFLQAQRDGPEVVPGPLGRRAAHLSDRSAAVYRTPAYRGTRLVGRLQPTGITRDVSGGWSDAGDYLKFVETTSFTDSLLLFAIREYPRAVPRAALAEARFGTDWLMRMWDPSTGVLYSQVGIGDGNGRTILGDHDLWRLPQADSRLSARPGSPTRYVARRPVFAANAPGKPISPNLAGRVAAAFGLCAQTFAATDPAYARSCLLAGQQVYGRADTAPRGHLTTVSPFVYYPEGEWRDDMELGATELSLATRRLGGAGMPTPDPNTYLLAAARWADAYMSSPSDGEDSFNLYDVSSLAHYDLVRILRGSVPADLRSNLATDPGTLIRDLEDNLRQGARLGAHDPFGLSNPATNVDDVPHALGYAIMARLTDALTGHRTFETLGQTQLDWVLGANPWGSTFVVGAGTTFPRCLAHQVANLSGSLTGRGALLEGAVVDGPTAPQDLERLGAPDGFRRCPATRVDPFRAFDGHATSYVDDVRSSSSSEPGDDYVALALLALAQQAAG